MEWKHFEDKETQDSVRGRWNVTGSTLTVYIKPPRFKRSLKQTEIGNNVKVNSDDLRCAQWIVEFLSDYIDETIQHINIGGYARGSAIAQVVAYKLIHRYLFSSIDIVLINTYKTGNKAFVDSISNYVTSILPERAFFRRLWLWPWYRLGNSWRKRPNQLFSRFYEIYGMR